VNDEELITYDVGRMIKLEAENSIHFFRLHSVKVLVDFSITFSDLHIYTLYKNRQSSFKNASNIQREVF
jgi:hypothetical protein